MSKLAIGRIVGVADDKPLGTGFAVARRLALTAFHCVGNTDTGQVVHSQVRLELREAQPTIADYITGDSPLDYALLQLAEPLDSKFEPIGFAMSIRALAPFRSVGFPISISEVDMAAVHGSVAGPESTIFDGIPAIQLYCNESAAGLRLRGLSGAPVLVGNPEAAIGLIRWNPPSEEDPSKGTAGIVYATSLLAIRQRHPVFFPDDQDKVHEEEFKHYVDSMLEYAYYFNQDGRKHFFRIDLWMTNENALGELQRSGIVRFILGVAVLGLPHDPETKGLDEQPLEHILNYCVAQGYLRKATQNFLYRDGFEITDKGRLYIIEKEMRLERRGR